MATPVAQLDQLIASTYDKLKSRVADNITKKQALLAALDSRAGVKEDGGLSIRLPIMYELNDTVKSYSGYDILDTTPQGGLAYAEYTWKQFAGAVTISGEEERKNAGGASVTNLVKFKFDQLEKSISQKLTDWFWATSIGNGGKDLTSIPVIVDNTGTLGGIDSSTETWWKSKVVGVAGDFASAPGVDLTGLAGVKKLNNILNSLAVDGSKPTHEFTTQANFEAYEALALNTLAYKDTKMAELGFESINHKTAEVVFEPAVPTFTTGQATDGGSWYFINCDELAFFKHSNAYMERTPFMRPVDQDAKTMQVVSMGNLATGSRRSHGLIRTAKVA